MGSQTLEILRQGLGSLTGGWFYDPSNKTTFANAVHLYIYLFLLCSPFVTYLVSSSLPPPPQLYPFSNQLFTFSFITNYFQYSPATLTAWVVYCSFVVGLMAALKIINLNMHGMYDRAQILSDPKASSGTVSQKAVG